MLYNTMQYTTLCSTANTTIQCTLKLTIQYYNTVQHNVPYNAIQCNAQHITLQYNTMQNTIQFDTM